MNFIKAINNYENYNYIYKSLNTLVLYKSNFTILLRPFKIVIIIFSLNILLEKKAISRTKENKIIIIKKSLTLKNKMFKDNSKYFKYFLKVAY
ncbi:hypothetical protein C8035_v007199 [Colletotrichum spinosum]|uniref:Uncharacterized protein n=1 Tax=Colletotrichum spinosum TaxID=1347390 RepID=A0A4R8Q5K5_9PEZI|nr:hypothetical protein C8035_v007199 [Colletotrichum spinosum]